MYRHALVFQADDSISVFCKMNVPYFLEYVSVNVSYKRDVVM